MAAPACTKDALVAASACYMGTILDVRMRKALAVYFMLQGLAAIGGTDYRDDFAGLDAAATNLLRDVPEDQRAAFELAILRADAVNDGATISSDINALQEAIKCLKIFPMEQLLRIQLFLECELGAWKAYPQ